MDETFNGVNAQEVAAPASEESTEQSAVSASQPVQDEKTDLAGGAKELSENQKWEIARKRAEKQAQERAKKEQQKLVEAFNAVGIQGSNPQEIILQLRAQQNGTTLDEERKLDAQRQEALQQAIDQSPDMLLAKQIVQKQKFDSDLQAIKAAYPDVEAREVGELGSVYIDLMAAAERGGISIDPVVAYEAQLAHDRRTTKPTPPSTGSARGDAGVEKEYYTSEELDRLTAKQLDDPVIFEKAFRSMKRLR